MIFHLACFKVQSCSKCVFVWVYACACSVAKSYPTLCDPMDCSPPGSSVHGLFQARVLEWGAIAFSHIFRKKEKEGYKWRTKQSLIQQQKPFRSHWAVTKESGGFSFSAYFPTCLTARIN